VIEGELFDARFNNRQICNKTHNRHCLPVDEESRPIVTILIEVKSALSIS